VGKLKHRWTERDTIIAYHLYRFGDKDLSFSQGEIGDLLGMGSASMGFKLANFKAVAGDGGLDQYTKLDETIFNRFQHLPDDEFRVVGLQAITDAMSDAIARRQSG
jgi:hypothetical protein